MIKLLYSAGI